MLIIICMMSTLSLTPAVQTKVSFDTDPFSLKDYLTMIAVLTSFPVCDANMETIGADIHAILKRIDPGFKKYDAAKV